MTCKQCGRNFIGKYSRNGYCSECSRMEYLYSQGAVTIDTWKKWKKSWIRDMK